MGVCSCGEGTDEENIAEQQRQDQEKKDKKHTKKEHKKHTKEEKALKKQKVEFIKLFLQSIEPTDVQKEQVAHQMAGGAIPIVDTIFDQCDTDANEIMLTEFDLDSSKTLTKEELSAGLQSQFKEHQERTTKFIIFLLQEELHCEELLARCERPFSPSAQIAAKKAREALAKAKRDEDDQMTPEQLQEEEQHAAAISVEADVRGKRVCKVERDEQKATKRAVSSIRKEPPAKIDWKLEDQSKWKFIETIYNGTYKYVTAPEMEQVKGLISEGKALIKANPDLYQGIWFQTSMQNWSADQQVYTLVKRKLGSEMLITAHSGGGFTHLKAKYEVLTEGITVVQDDITDVLSAGGYQGYLLKDHLLPGRGQGIADVPSIKLMNEINPSDVAQGSVGDCWLLSAISCLAEYGGAIDNIFSKTSDIAVKPSNASNMYTVTLYDLPSGKPVDLQVDERLCNRSDGSGLLGAQPSISGELWVPYLEKAIAAHCGGNVEETTEICQEQYTLRKDRSGAFKAYGAYNPNEQCVEPLENSPHDGFSGLWPMEWPQVGGGGSMRMCLSEDQMFERMCAWEDAGFMMAAGTKAGSDTEDTDGIVDGHAYSILDVENDVGEGKFDMIKVRNPWGKGEMTSGKWDDDGPGWTQHPDVKAALKPLGLEDGIFWLEKAEFFEYFPSVYLCAKDMSASQ